MTYLQRTAGPLAALTALLAVTIVLGSPAKLDHLAGSTSAAHHSRGGFRAGTHDTGIWGANLDKSRQLTPPVWGNNQIADTSRGSSNKKTTAFDAFPSSNFGAQLHQQQQHASSNKFGAPQHQQQQQASSNIFFGAKPSFGSQKVSSSGSNGNRFGSQSTLSQGYVPPPAAAPSQQGYNYSPPQTPVNLYQPPPPAPTTTTTTTTRRPPPPPPSGLYETPTNYRPIPQRPRVTPRPTTTTRHPRPTTTTTRRPPPPAPTSLYQTPQDLPPPPNSLYQTPQASRPVPQVAQAPAMPAMPYDFAYGVSDSNSGNQYSRQESHDGNVMRGQYSVLLPDGRTQVVTYYDDGSGFNAEVTYQ